jgi:hypothetical protein
MEISQDFLSTYGSTGVVNDLINFPYMLFKNYKLVHLHVSAFQHAFFCCKTTAFQPVLIQQ